MDTITRTIVLGAALTVIVGITAVLRAHTGISSVEEGQTEVSPNPSPSAELPSPTPAESSDEPEETVQPSSPQSQNKGISSSEPSPIPSPSPSPTPSPSAEIEASTTPSDAEGEVSVSFVNLPSEVKAGQEFTATWRVDGPAGKEGENTKLEVLYNVSSSEDGSSSHVNSSNKQSFGPFQIPDSFSADFTFGSMPGPVQLTAEATVDGKTYTKEATVQVVE